MHIEDTKPGDVVSTDESGNIRVSRIIPIPYLIGGLVAVAGQAVALYYGQQRMSDELRVMQADMKSIGLQLAVSATKGVEYSMRITELERRLNNVEDAQRGKR